MADESGNQNQAEAGKPSNPSVMQNVNDGSDKLKIFRDKKQKINISALAEEIKSGDHALNKLKIQNLDFILDIPLKISVELGRTSLYVKDILQLGQGSVLELDKLAGEPLEVLVNGKLIARGEVVVVNEKFGIRLTDIISPIERIESLK
jgi:flagellar motor switch protein FliN/FliY